VVPLSFDLTCLLSSVPTRPSARDGTSLQERKNVIIRCTVSSFLSVVVKLNNLKPKGLPRTAVT